MSKPERIFCTAMEAATEHKDKVGTTHLARVFREGSYGGWCYYDRIMPPNKQGSVVKAQREKDGFVSTNRWNPNTRLELVPIGEVPEEYLPDQLTHQIELHELKKVLAPVHDALIALAGEASDDLVKDLGVWDLIKDLREKVVEAEL